MYIEIIAFEDCIKAHYTPKKTGFESDRPEQVSGRFRAARQVSGKGTLEQLTTTLLDTQSVKVKAGTADGPKVSF